MLALRRCMASAPAPSIRGAAALSTAAAAEGRPLHLGLDSSTQGLKAVVIDARRLEPVGSAAVNYAEAYPDAALGAGGAVYGDGGRVTQPTAMYFRALDDVMTELQRQGLTQHLVGVSGAGQQHGSVYWNADAPSVLAQLDHNEPLAAQVQRALAIPYSPIWMDSSTSKYCRAVEAGVGGPQALAAITGSRAYERFTLNQILKVRDSDAEGYAATAHISLISSAMPSVLTGTIAPIDLSDGSGMNLLDLATATWSPTVLKAVGADGDVDVKLGSPVPSPSVLGTVHDYFVKRYGVPASCTVTAWTGDNPSSVAGLGLTTAGHVAVSLGTSDTVFAIVDKWVPGVEGHVLFNPVDPETFMTMLCFKNGSLAREHVRDTSAGRSWDTFNDCLPSTPPGNDGFFGFFYLEPEITPTVAQSGVTRYRNRTPVDAFPTAAHEVRAVVESQFLSMRSHCEGLGLEAGGSVHDNLVVTGGASKNPAIVQILADVFGKPVFAADSPDSAAAGAAYRSIHATEALCSFEDIIRRGLVGPPGFGPAYFTQVATPNPDAHAVYTAMLPLFQAAERKVVAALQHDPASSTE